MPVTLHANALRLLCYSNDRLVVNNRSRLDSTTPPVHKRTRYCFAYFLTSPRKSAPYTLPSESAVTPSAMLEIAGYGYGHGSGIKDLTFPSLALPIRMPRCAPRL